MSDPSQYTYPSPLKGWENLPPLSEEKNEDGKSLKNPETGKLSEAYEKFVAPLDNGRRGGFDVHIYHFQANESQKTFAKELYERVRREFPELRIYKFWEVPIGPHPVAMFEVNLFTPAQFGAFIPWLVINRGPLSALVHPNTEVEEGEDEWAIEYRNHTQRATWLGESLPLDLSMFHRMSAKAKAEKEANGKA